MTSDCGNVGLCDRIPKRPKQETLLLDKTMQKRGNEKKDGGMDFDFSKEEFDF